MAAAAPAFTATDEIRAAIATLAALFEMNMLDKANLAEGLGFIADACATIDGKPAVDATLKLPLLTLADVVGQHRAPGLRVVQGGLA